MNAELSRLLVDTDVVSFFFKRDTRAARYEPHLQEHLLAISFMTLAELERWKLQHRWGKRRVAELEAHLAQYLVYPFDRDLCRWWAFVVVEARRAGRPIATSDAWIAATALLYGLPLITHNPDHFVGVPGLTVISEPTTTPGP